MSSHCVVAVSPTQAIVFGSAVYSFDYDTLLYTALTSTPVPTIYSACVVVTWTDGMPRVLLIGGHNSALGYVSLVQLYDFAADSWATGVPDLPLVIAHLTAAVVNSVVYTFGGIHNGSSVLASIYSYVPGAAEWTLTQFNLSREVFNTWAVPFMYHLPVAATPDDLYGNG
jgi:hypothetical protein